MSESDLTATFVGGCVGTLFSLASILEVISLPFLLLKYFLNKSHMDHPL